MSLILIDVISSSFPLAPSLSLLESNCDVGWHGEDLKIWMGAGGLDSRRVSKSQLRALRKSFYHVHCLLGESWVTLWPAIYLHSRGCCFLAHGFQMPLFQNRLRSSLSTWHKKDLFCLVVSKDSGHGDLVHELRQNAMVDKEVW